ncbi:MAG: aminotransferase class IV, partial [Parvularculaceae bacterium]
PPTVLASMSRLSAFPEGCKLKLARARRYSGALGARCKLVGGYVDNLAALAEARAAGADEAIMLNERGDVACASAANIFLISPAGVAATPRLSDGALPGVVRSILIAGAHDVRIEERSVRVEELSAALVLLTNSLRGVALCARAGATPGQARAAAALKSCYAEALAAELGREKP